MLIVTVVFSWRGQTELMWLRRYAAPYVKGFGDDTIVAPSSNPSPLILAKQVQAACHAILAKEKEGALNRDMHQGEVKVLQYCH